jgi:acetolactate decarboxylase
VRLDALRPDSATYAVGALADLAGEVTILGGDVVLATAGDEPADGAALLVVADVPAWTSFPVAEPIALDRLGVEIARLAGAAGWPSDARVPFLVEGDVEDLRWHVIDGRRLPSGPATHADHLEAAQRFHEPRARATLVGFYSDHDQGVFTHHGETTHVHCVLPDRRSGHVDAVVIPKGAVVRVPAEDGAVIAAALEHFADEEGGGVVVHHTTSCPCWPDRTNQIAADLGRGERWEEVKLLATALCARNREPVALVDGRRRPRPRCEGDGGRRIARILRRRQASIPLDVVRAHSSRSDAVRPAAQGQRFVARRLG